MKKWSCGKNIYRSPHSMLTCSKSWSYLPKITFALMNSCIFLPFHVLTKYKIMNIFMMIRGRSRIFERGRKSINQIVYCRRYKTTISDSSHWHCHDFKIKKKFRLWDIVRGLKFLSLMLLYKTLTKLFIW